MLRFPFLNYALQPLRPKFSDLEKEYKAQGKEMKAPDVRKEIRAKYRRRPIKEWIDANNVKQPGVMDEIEDETLLKSATPPPTDLDQ